ncbi:S-type pyocin domain-containing protein [Pseudomonas sp. X10]
MAQDNAYHLTEGLWITAAAPDRTPLPPLNSGGGGPGYGGWGLSDGRPRGTGGPNKNLNYEISTRRVLGEERQSIDREYADKYAPLIKDLPAQIAAQRAQVREHANKAGATSLLRQAAEQHGLTSLIRQKRENYLRILPDALSFYGSPSFYKRSDSMMSRIYDPGVFTQRGEAFANEFWSRLNRSADGAYRLHIEATAIHSLANDLPSLALQHDLTELQSQPVDLPKAISRRTAQLHQERQICFECLPNFLQHELVKSTTVKPEHNLAQAISAYLASAASLIASKQRNIPKFKTHNPEIKSPLSKPQLEALHHLVAEQKIRRAGSLWKEYHSALTQTESIRYLQWFTAALKGLHQRAEQIEALQKKYQAELVAAREAQEAARKKAEAERKAKEAAQKAEAERKAKEDERKRTSYVALGSASASIPLVIPIGSAAFDLTLGGYLAMQQAIRIAVLPATASAGAVALPFIVGVVSLLWPSTLGNSERQYLTSVPLADLSPLEGIDLAALAAAGGSLKLPYTLGTRETEDQLHLMVTEGSGPIPVRAATFDNERQVYSLALDNPSRLLTWTPANAPDNDQSNSTSLPPTPPGVVIYAGNTLKPPSNEQEIYPALDLLDLERLIVTFPADSGLAPILIVFRDPRLEPGAFSGSGEFISDTWLNEKARGAGAPVPTQIAEKLSGKHVSSIKDFREILWKTVAEDKKLSTQFSESNVKRMKLGLAPKVQRIDRHKSQSTYVLHHHTPISEGGAVYDLDNIRVVTPSAHQHIHYGTKP